jgi:hypothetical protein
MTYASIHFDSAGVTIRVCWGVVILRGSKELVEDCSIPVGTNWTVDKKKIMMSTLDSCSVASDNL